MPHEGSHFVANSTAALFIISIARTETVKKHDGVVQRGASFCLSVDCIACRWRFKPICAPSDLQIMSRVAVINIHRFTRGAYFPIIFWSSWCSFHSAIYHNCIWYPYLLHLYSCLRFIICRVCFSLLIILCSCSKCHSLRTNLLMGASWCAEVCLFTLAGFWLQHPLRELQVSYFVFTLHLSQRHSAEGNPRQETVVCWMRKSGGEVPWKMWRHQGCIPSPTLFFI